MLKEESKKTQAHYPKDKSFLFWTLIVSSLALLLFIYWLVIIDKNSVPDQRVFDFFSTQITTNRTSIMSSVSFLGNHKFLIPANLVLIFYFVLRKKKWDGFRVLFVAITSLGMMSLLKNLVQRQRPFDPLIDGITNYSFPSGHAFMSVAFFGLLIYFAIYNERYKWLENIFITAVLLLIFIIGISRIYLRVHYTTDVIAGWICGSLWLVFCFYLLNRIKRKIPVEKK